MLLETLYWGLAMAVLEHMTLRRHSHPTSFLLFVHCSRALVLSCSRRVPCLSRRILRSWTHSHMALRLQHHPDLDQDPQNIDGFAKDKVYKCRCNAYCFGIEQIVTASTYYRHRNYIEEHGEDALAGLPSTKRHGRKRVNSGNEQARKRRQGKQGQSVRASSSTSPSCTHFI
jgi:hypothetical protein